MPEIGAPVYRCGGQRPEPTGPGQQPVLGDVRIVSEQYVRQGGRVPEIRHHQQRNLRVHAQNLGTGDPERQPGGLGRETAKGLRLVAERLDDRTAAADRLTTQHGAA
ncbi:hypothetical protein ABZZ20_11755 [Streptomyces sp. NPDC006430]|uniref:hypothetical protein n=1 Tax=Streptomyces sp. NPDC006430 TaxID=3154299 RepID=UPI0033B81777